MWLNSSAPETWLGVAGSESTWLCWWEKRKHDARRDKQSLQNTQNNPPALCSLSRASQERFKRGWSWAAAGWRFWEVQDTSVKGKGYSKHHKAPRGSATKRRSSYITSITDCPSEWVGQMCHRKASNHSTRLAVIPHTLVEEGHLPAQFLMHSAFHGTGGEPPGNESRGDSLLSFQHYSHFPLF